MKTADELVVEGEERLKRGCVVIFLYPSQEWMAIKMQCPFLRYPKMPVDKSEPPIPYRPAPE